MTSRFILDKFDLNLPPSGFLILRFLLLLIVVAAALCGVLVGYEAVLGDAGLGEGLGGQVGRVGLLIRLLGVLLGISDGGVGHVEGGSLALAHGGGRCGGCGGGGGVVLAGEGGLLGVVGGRGLGGGERVGGCGGGGCRGEMAIGHVAAHGQGCVRCARRRAQTLTASASVLGIAEVGRRGKKGRDAHGSVWTIKKRHPTVFGCLVPVGVHLAVRHARQHPTQHAPTLARFGHAMSSWSEPSHNISITHPLTSQRVFTPASPGPRAPGAPPRLCRAPRAAAPSRARPRARVCHTVPCARTPPPPRLPSATTEQQISQFSLPDTRSTYRSARSSSVGSGAARHSLRRGTPPHRGPRTGTPGRLDRAQSAASALVAARLASADGGREWKTDKTTTCPPTAIAAGDML